MYDRETRSLWIHTTGQAVKGELRGRSLEFLPSEIVPWQVWREQHPDTLVLDRGGQGGGFMGSFRMAEEGGEFGISVGSGNAVTLYPYELLAETGILHGPGEVVALDPESGVVRAYERGEESYTLGDDGRLHSGERSYDLLTGEGEGGTVLRRLPATAWLIERWEDFHPDGRIIEE